MALVTRAPPTASNSSINTTQGLLRRACSGRKREREIKQYHIYDTNIMNSPNSFLTLAAPTPTNISSNSLPDAKKNGTSASPAIALANSVFPVPGGPISNTPNNRTIQVYIINIVHTLNIQNNTSIYN